MVFRLKTSKRTQDIFQELERRTNYKPYTLVKHAIAWSVKENTSVENFVSDSDGLDLNRQTITGDNEAYFKVLIEEVEGRYLPEEEYFPKYVKAHVDRGSKLLLDMYNHAGSVEKYILQVLGVGDTV
ncbi:MAG: DndE family protein [Lachnospiraceae bacterium]|jgi:DNA sulfur modification protein DndE|nr:DndE family protein [uncultured Acetatifactor sp.]MCI9221725.1 DndE family protein [Lachnospiraceae bacterium]